MSQDTAKSTVDIAFWREHVDATLGQQLRKAGIESQPATGTGPNEVHTAFRIDEETVRNNQADQKYVLPAAEALIRDIKCKRVTVMIDVQDVAGCPGIAIRLFPQE
jgi:hypothetical protein